MVRWRHLSSLVDTGLMRKRGPFRTSRHGDAIELSFATLADWCGTAIILKKTKTRRELASLGGFFRALSRLEPQK